MKEIFNRSLRVGFYIFKKLLAQELWRFYARHIFQKSKDIRIECVLYQQKIKIFKKLSVDNCIIKARISVQIAPLI